MSENNKNIVILILFVGLAFLWSNYRELKNEYADNLDVCEQSLHVANENIDDANDYILNAKDYAWSSYDDMGEALEGLETVDNVR
jgi:hypothetical protein